MIGDFESAAEGWKAVDATPSASTMLTTSTDAEHGAASGKFTGSFPGRTGYVSLERSFPSIDVREVSLWVKTTQVNPLTIRFVDATGQTHQQRLDLANTPGWQKLTITSLDHGPIPEHWGGANDGVWHGPATNISIIIDSSQLTDPAATSGTVLVDDIEVWSPTPVIELTQTSYGNVFLPGQPDSVGVTTAAGTLNWAVTDVHGTTLRTGSQTHPTPSSVLTLPDLDLGWYRLHVDAVNEGTIVGGADTTFARVPEPPTASAATRSMFAVSTHFASTQSLETMSLISKMGAGNIRDELWWGAVEKTKGVYTWPALDQTYLTTAAQAGIKPLLIAGYGNPLYDRGNGPISPEAVAAYANYAAAMVDHYASQISGIEIWNEWDLGGGDSTNKLPDQYVRLLKAASQKIKASHPEIPVLGPATSSNTLWLEDTVKLGALAYVDGVVLHPYTWPAVGAELLDGILTNVETLIKKYNNGAMKKVYITEQGWPTGTEVRSVSEESQAANIVKAQMIALSHGVSRYHIYDMVNDGMDPKNTEANYGLLHNPADPLGANTPKPAYAAEAALTSTLTGANFVKRETAPDGVSDYLFDKSGTQIRGLWSTTGGTVTLHAHGRLRVTDAYGKTTEFAHNRVGVTLTLGEAPVYVSGTVKSVVKSATTLVIDPNYLGSELKLHWTVDNTMNPRKLVTTLAIAGKTVTQTVPKRSTRTLDFTLPAPTTLGALTLTGEMSTTRGDHQVLTGELVATTTTVVSEQLTGVHAVNASGADVLRLRISNASDVAQTVSSLDYTLGTTSGSGPAQSVIAPRSALVQDVPLVGLATATPWTSTAVIAGHGTLKASGTVRTSDPAARTAVHHQTIKVDGVLDAMSTAPTVNLDTQGHIVDSTWAGPADLGGKVWLTWDETNMYLSAVITDNIHSQPATAGNIWQGDAVQLAIGKGAPGEQAAWSELGAALTQQGPQLYRWVAAGEAQGLIPGSQVGVTRDEAAHTTTYELAVPWSHLDGIIPQDGLISASLVANDNDGAGRAGYIEWGAGIASTKDSSLFKPLMLVP